MRSLWYSVVLVVVWLVFVTESFHVIIGKVSKKAKRGKRFTKNYINGPPMRVCTFVQCDDAIVKRILTALKTSDLNGNPRKTRERSIALRIHEACCESPLRRVRRLVAFPQHTDRRRHKSRQHWSSMKT